jgi:hypothetical protein
VWGGGRGVRALEGVLQLRGWFLPWFFLRLVSDMSFLRAVENLFRKFYGTNFFRAPKIAIEQLFLLYRLFDKNGDGFVNKREFKWMASKERLNKKQIDLTFQVHFLFDV